MAEPLPVPWQANHLPMPGLSGYRALKRFHLQIIEAIVACKCQNLFCHFWHIGFNECIDITEPKLKLGRVVIQRSFKIRQGLLLALATEPNIKPPKNYAGHLHLLDCLAEQLRTDPLLLQSAIAAAVQ